MGRKPLGDKPLTNAQKQLAQRKARAAELTRLRAVAIGFMRCIQTDNNCGVTGQPCDEICGCRDEMMEWCK